MFRSDGLLALHSSKRHQSGLFALTIKLTAMDAGLTELKQRFAEFFENSPLTDFDEDDVPEGVRKLIPLAKFWNIADDGYREKLIDSAPRAALEGM